MQYARKCFVDNYIMIKLILDKLQIKLPKPIIKIIIKQVTNFNVHPHFMTSIELFKASNIYSYDFIIPFIIPFMKPYDISTNAVKYASTNFIIKLLKHGIIKYDIISGFIMNRKDINLFINDIIQCVVFVENIYCSQLVRKIIKHHTIVDKSFWKYIMANDCMSNDMVIQLWECILKLDDDKLLGEIISYAPRSSIKILLEINNNPTFVVKKQILTMDINWIEFINLSQEDYKIIFNDILIAENLQYWDNNIVDNLLDINIKFLKYIPYYYIGTNTIEYFINVNIKNIKYIPFKLQTKHLCKHVVSTKPKYYKYCKNLPRKTMWKYIKNKQLPELLKYYKHINKSNLKKLCKIYDDTILKHISYKQINDNLVDYIYSVYGDKMFKYTNVYGDSISSTTLVKAIKNNIKLAKYIELDFIFNETDFINMFKILATNINILIKTLVNEKYIKYRDCVFSEIIKYISYNELSSINKQIFDDYTTSCMLSWAWELFSVTHCVTCIKDQCPDILSFYTKEPLTFMLKRKALMGELSVHIPSFTEEEFIMMINIDSTIIEKIPSYIKISYKSCLTYLDKLF